MRADHLLTPSLTLLIAQKKEKTLHGSAFDESSEAVVYKITLQPFFIFPRIHDPQLQFKLGLPLNSSARLAPLSMGPISGGLQAPDGRFPNIFRTRMVQ